MKENTMVNKVIIGVICAAVILYFAVYLALGFRNDLVTTTAYAYSVDVGTQASALLVRQEQVLPNSGQYVDILLDEGEKVSKGGEIALIHSSQDSLDTRQTIQSLEAEIQQLEYSLSTGTQTTNSSRLDEEVVNSMVSIRSLAAAGDLSTLEDSALHLRTMVFQRDYVYGNTQAATQISQLIQDKKKQLDQLNASLSQAAQTITAPASGYFSGEVDGFESLVPGDALLPHHLPAHRPAGQGAHRRPHRPGQGGHQLHLVPGRPHRPGVRVRAGRGQDLQDLLLP